MNTVQWIKRRNFLLALYWFCAHYHSGQWSRGYRLLCRAGKRLREEYDITHPLDEPFLGIESTRIYKKLEDNNSEEV